MPWHPINIAYPHNLHARIHGNVLQKGSYGSPWLRVLPLPLSRFPLPSVTLRLGGAQIDSVARPPTDVKKHSFFDIA